MELDSARAFLAEHHRCVLVTRRSNGSVQTSPVVASMDKAGRAVISSREPAMKTRNIRRNNEVSLCVFTDQFFGKWVQIDGTAVVESLPSALEDLVELYRSVSGEHPNWDEYREAMFKEQRVILAISITHAGPDRAG